MSADLTGAQRRAVWRQAMSVGVATGAYGVSFGALSVGASLSVWQTIALSALVFTGGSQFAFVGVVSAGGSAATAVAVSTLLGIRNGFYGLQVSQWLHAAGLRRAVAAQLTIDESTAVSLGQRSDPARRLGFWTTGAGVYLWWNAFTVAGAVLGNTVGDPRRYGLDAAAAAAFCALLWPRLHARDALATAAVAAVLTVASAPWAPAGIPVLVGGLAAAVVGLVGRRGEERR